MRTMASVWFSVIVLLSVQKAFGSVCLKNENDFSCNECIRCGGDWCNERRAPHCVFSLEDGWCPNDQELLPEVAEVAKPGVAVNPVYAERTLYIGKPNKLDIQYAAKNKQKAKMMIVHSTQSFNIELKEYEPKCSGINCTTTIEATPSQEFCNATGGLSEYVEVKINVGLDEEVTVKYFVPCACECSFKVEKRSQICNKNGDLSCGVCTCYAGWTGESCEKPICDEKRGDVVQCSINPRNDADCSGNGYCGTCETCICYSDREGSQYFDQENNCADLCMVASECEDCLLNSTAGECDSCIHSMTIKSYNQSLTEDRDELNRKIWVTCNETIVDCRIDYVAMRDEIGEIYVMIVRSCNDVDAAAVVAGQKVSIIVGVLGIVAAVAAVGGIMLWKHLNTVPPVPLNDPQYQNIDAEDCTGENPLYKPPTSSFKNPTYGKW